MPSALLLILLTAAGDGSFTWSAPESCPDEEAVRDRLARNLSDVQATVIASEGGFELTVSIDGQLRKLTTPSCSEAADTTVFLVALVGRTSTAPRKVVAPPSSAAVWSPPPPVTRAPAAHLHLTVLGGAELLLLPLAVPRFGVSLQVELPWVTFSFELRTAPPLQFFLPDSASGIELSPSLDVQTGACRMFSVGPVRAGPCVQAGLGAVWVLGLNVLGRRTRVVPVWTAGPALRLAIALGPLWELQAFFAARFGPRPVYSFDGFSVVETAAVGLDTGLGVGARW